MSGGSCSGATYESVSQKGNSDVANDHPEAGPLTFGREWLSTERPAFGVWPRGVGYSSQGAR